MPLLLSHGWPGSVVEFRHLIPMLTDPARFGADPADAFTVVAPSPPGYGFSFSPNQPRLGVVEIADAFAMLMTDILGYRRFGAQGGDWGAFVTSRLGLAYPERLTGIHLTMLTLPREPESLSRSTDGELEYHQQLREWLQEDTGYQWIQGTKPQTLAYALTDSPVGLLAWLVEKFQAWSDCDGDVSVRFSNDVLLTNTMLYWATGAINSSFWPYYDRRHRSWPIPARRTDHRTNGLCRVSTRNASPTALIGRADVQHPTVDADAEGRALLCLRRTGGARSRHPSVLPRIALVGRSSRQRHVGTAIAVTIARVPR